MSKALRNQYMQQLGIVQYVGRDLPVITHQPAIQDHSTQPVAAQSTEASEAEVRLSDSMGSQVNALIREKSMAELVNIGLDNDVTQNMPAPVVPAEQAAAPTAEIELRLALWQPTEELLVCCSAEDSRPQPEHSPVLGNILRAMWHRSGQLPQIELVEWPPYPNMAGEEAEVREFLATLMQARIDSSATKILLLLGDTVPQWLLSPEQLASVANGQVDAFGQITALLIPSLAKMIEQPSCKREAWQTLRYLSPLRHVHKADG